MTTNEIVHIDTESNLTSGKFITYCINGVMIPRVVEFKYETGVNRLRYVTLKLEVAEVLIDETGDE